MRAWHPGWRWLRHFRAAHSGYKWLDLNFTVICLLCCSQLACCVLQLVLLLWQSQFATYLDPGAVSTAQIFIFICVLSHYSSYSLSLFFEVTLFFISFTNKWFGNILWVQFGFTLQGQILIQSFQLCCVSCFAKVSALNLWLELKPVLSFRSTVF